MKVKIFDCLVDRKTFENNINKFIEKIEKEHMEVVDIKYISHYDYGGSVSVLIMYKPDGILRLDMGLWEGVPEIRDGRTNI